MSKKKILVVEDHENILKLECVLLNSLGYETKGVADGPAALTEMLNSPPDLVLLDIMIPHIDGYKVCRLVKSNKATRHIPVIMLTAKQSAEDIAMSRQVGADCHIPKPFNSAMLVKTIQNFLGA
jgi:twitching motility two-component system response regulator PilG